MEPRQIANDIAAPKPYGADTPEQHIDMLIKAYREDRLQTYHGTIGLSLKDAEEYADTDAANLRARMIERLGTARKAREVA